MNVEKMTLEELNVEVAEKIFDRPPTYYDCPHFDKHERILAFCSCPDLPEYSRDIAAAMRMEDRIEELGLIPKYCEALLNITDASEHFELIHASPEDRCRAAVMATEAE